MPKLWFSDQFYTFHLLRFQGFGALVFYKLSQKLQSNKKYLGLVGYTVFIITAFFAMPENPDEITAPMNLVNEFRLMSVLGVTSFWISVGIILGLLWNKFDNSNSSPDYS